MEYNNQEICSRSRNRKTSIIIQLLNNNYNVVDELQGVAIGGTINIKNGLESNYSRRSGSIDLLLTSDLSTQYYKLDLNHIVRILIRVTDNITRIYADYNMGIYIISNVQLGKSVGGKKISISLLDIMSRSDGTMGGALINTWTAEVDSGKNVSLALHAVGTDMMGLPNDKMKIESTDLTVIEAVSTDPTGTICDHIKSILTYAINYDLYFNEDGVLCFEYIQSRDNDPIFQEFINSDVVISYDVTEDFTNVRNSISVLGCQLENSTIQVQSEYKEKNLKNPLNIYAIGEKRLILSNDKLLDESMCYEQAKYECRKRSNYNEKISFQILPDYRLQPNKKIKIKYSSIEEDLEIDGYYLIDEINCDLKTVGLMNITCHKLYPIIS